ncbi:MAG: nucleoside triphosphate hydrolase [Zetaproteobacteria bacterium CG2_30_46_52]|nr:MAG: nucleoside triphosphate hydrolase [Zetaproteobacteria bacterium CG2_30_46_52]
MPHRVRDLTNPFDRLDTLMKILRVECDWDKKQTLASLRKYTLEETHEVLEAIEKAINTDEWDDLKSELGDALIQIAFYARIADEQDKFNLEDVFNTLIEKMIYRHPHVFADATPDDVVKQWESLKDVEYSERKSLMDGIPPMSALSVATKQQQRAARVGFDWPDLQGVTDKIHEEIDELAVEVAAITSDKEDAKYGDEANLRQVEDEFGDVLFSLVNYARKLGIDPEQALMQTNRKFDRRFRSMEKLAEEQMLNLNEMHIDALEDLYQQAKAKVK